MFADFLKYFAAALLTQVSILVIFAVLMYVWLQYDAETPLFFIFLASIVYAWPSFFIGLLSIPVTVVGYSFLFAVIKMVRDSYREP